MSARLFDTERASVRTGGPRARRGLRIYDAMNAGFDAGVADALDPEVWDEAQLAKCPYTKRKYRAAWLYAREEGLSK